MYHALVDPGVLRNLRPAALVDRALQCTAAEWMREVTVPLLLVKVDDLEGELALALEGRASDRALGEGGLSFHTVSTHAVSRRPKSIPPPPSLAPGQLVVRLVRAPHVVVPVSKREEAGRVFAERVTVGRARNSDIVLRHESVSKFHAWLARDERNRYYLADASSRNGTTRNGAPVPGGEPVALTPGDLVRFGDVEATYCDAATFHDALHT